MSNGFLSGRGARSGWAGSDGTDTFAARLFRAGFFAARGFRAFLPASPIAHLPTDGVQLASRRCRPAAAGYASRRLTGSGAVSPPRTKREAGAIPAQGRCCVRPGSWALLATVTRVTGRPTTTRYEP